jgi:hypothetical protein
MRVIGLDVHRTFAAVAVLDHTRLPHPGRVELTREAVLAFGRKLRPDDEVVIEATVNTAMIARLLRPFVGKVVIANPPQVRAIAHAKIKTDKIDATVLAKLHASGFLPEVWMPDDRRNPSCEPALRSCRLSNPFRLGSSCPFQVNATESLRAAATRWRGRTLGERGSLS